MDAGLGSVGVQTLNQSNDYSVHVEIPVRLTGGTADLRVTVSIVGLNKFTTTSGADDGAWTCVATTPMAGAGKTAVLRCTLQGADPGAALDLGLNVGYAGNSASLSAVLDVLEPAVDSESSDNVTSAPLPPRND